MFESGRSQVEGYEMDRGEGLLNAGYLSPKEWNPRKKIYAGRRNLLCPSEVI